MNNTTSEQLVRPIRGAGAKMNRSEALAARLEAGAGASPHLRPLFPKQSGRRAFPMTDGRLA